MVVKILKVNQSVTPIEKIDDTKIKVDSPKIDSKDCLCCLLRPMLFISRLTGLAPIYGYCDHTKKNFAQHFRKSTPLTIMSFILLVILSISTGMNILLLTKQQNPRLIIVQATILILFEVLILGDLLMAITRSKDRAKQLNALVAIISNKQYYGLNEMFTKKQWKKLRRLSRIYLLIIFLITLTHFIQIVLFTQSIDYSSVSRAMSSFVCLGIEMFYMIHFALKMHIYKTLLTTAYSALKNNLSERLYQQNNEQQTKWPLFKTLRKIQRLHCAINLNFKATNCSINPFLLYQFLINVIMTILCYYLLTTTWILGTERSAVSFSTEFKLYCIEFMVFYVLNCIQSVKEPVSIWYQKIYL